MRKLKVVLSALLITVASVVYAQNITVKGVVTDASTGEPLSGAAILVKGTPKGVVADVDGRYTISVPANGTLGFTTIGFKSVEIEVNGQTTINASLQPDNELLQETIVVAFGTTTKEAFTGSASVVNSAALEKRQTSNVVNALVGNVTGLQMKGGSGAPGSNEGSINIRGVNSIGAGSEPLVIVDGAPFPASLSNIPQADIESITVLKDAASAALYGARGAAGVILITTKKGKSGQAVVNVDIKAGVNSRSVPDYDKVTNPAEYYEAYYAQLYNKYYYGNGESADDAWAHANSQVLNILQYNVYSLPNATDQLIGKDGKINPAATLGRAVTLSDGSVLWMQPDDWNKEAYKKGIRQEYTANISSGNEKSSIYAGFNYLNEDGIIDCSNYKRLSARVKADYQVSKWLKVGANVAYTNSTKNDSQGLETGLSDGNPLGATNLFYYTTMIGPIYPVFLRGIDADGNPYILSDANGNKKYDTGVAATNFGVTRPFSPSDNPLGANQYNTYTTKGNQFSGTFKADFDITPFLKANITSNVLWGSSNLTDFYSMFYGSAAGVGGKLQKSNTTSIRTNNIQTLTYYDSFGDHNVNVLLGHEYYDQQSYLIRAAGIGLYTPEVKEIAAAAKADDNTTSNSSEYNTEGFFASAQYNYASKYYASASFRRDASSYFHKNHRWGNFWSVGGAWIINKESFMNTVSWVDLLKLKLSYGQQGKDDIGAYNYIDLYTLKSDGTAMSPSFAQKGNENISWEKTGNLNFGVEFSLFGGRLDGGFDLYTKNTRDLLFWISTPESWGSTGYYGNAGSIRNNGFELELNGRIVDTKLVKWNVYGNITFNKDKITSLPESKIDPKTGGYRTGSYFMRVGGSQYNYYCREFAGLDEQGQALYYYDTEDAEGNVVKRGGKTASFESADYYEQGSILPVAFGGFGTTLSVGNFDFTASFDYQIGGKVYDTTYAALMNNAQAGSPGSGIHKDWKKSWSPVNTTSDLPRWQYGDNYQSSKCDRFLTNAGYLNFSSFTVGYTLPSKLLKDKAKIRVYAAGENLCFWSARKGLDPRNAFAGLESQVSTYSPIRTISGGVQFTF